MREDVLFKNGDLVFNETNSDVEFGPSDEQHIEDTIAAIPGNWPEHPADGVALMTYLGASGEEQVLARKAKIQLQADGYQANNVTAVINNDKIILTPNVKGI